jgi:hypothetical protein
MCNNRILTVKETKALTRFSKKWFHNVKDALEKSYNTTLRNLDNARMKAGLLIGETICSKENTTNLCRYQRCYLQSRTRRISQMVGS